MVMVLGGAGYIGSHMAKLLRMRNVEHFVADNLENGHLAAVGESEFEQVDIRDAESLDNVFARRRIESVILFAGYISVGESMREPGKYFENNVSGCVNILRAMEKHGSKNIIFSSTAAVYGEPEYVPIDENHRKNPTNVYGESKLMMEDMLQWYARQKGFRAISLRYFNAAGADPQGELGEDHRPEEHLIPATIEAAMGRRDKLTIFGDDYPTPDGTCVRDYIHVWDLAEAHLLALESFGGAEEGIAKAFNLGSGTGFSVREVIETVSSVAGTEVPYEVGPRRTGDPARLIASSEQIRSELGWQPQFDNIERMVSDAWNWRRAHPEGYAS